MLCFRFPDRLVKICADCNFFSAQKKKKVGDRPVQRFQFLSKVKTISLREFVRADFRIFSVFNIYIKNNNIATVLTRPSTLVAIYFDKCSHIPASNVIKAVRHNAPLSLLYEDGHPRCKGFRLGVKCAVRRKSGQIVYRFVRPVYNYDFRVSAIPVSCKICCSFWT